MIWYNKSIANDKKAEVMTLKKISLDEFLKLRKLVHRSARPLDYTKWKFLFENGSCDDFLSVLSSYQNEDGGFHKSFFQISWFSAQFYQTWFPDFKGFSAYAG